MQIYQQQGVQLYDANQRIDIFIEENNNYYEIGNGYLDFDITLRKNNGSFNNIVDGNVDEPTRMNKIAFFYAFSIATLPTTGEEKQQKKYVCHESTIMRVSASNDGEVLSFFDKTNETQNTSESSSIYQILIDNFGEVADRGEFESHLPLEHTFGFCKTFKNMTKNYVFIEFSKPQTFRIFLTQPKALISRILF